MIKSVEAYSLECDKCKCIYENPDDEDCSVYLDAGDLVERGDIDGWLQVENEAGEDYWYCPLCRGSVIQ